MPSNTRRAVRYKPYRRTHEKGGVSQTKSGGGGGTSTPSESTSDRNRRLLAEGMAAVQQGQQAYSQWKTRVEKQYGSSAGVVTKQVTQTAQTTFTPKQTTPTPTRQQVQAQKASEYQAQKQELTRAGYTLYETGRITQTTGGTTTTTKTLEATPPKSRWRKAEEYVSERTTKPISRRLSSIGITTEGIIEAGKKVSTSFLSPISAFGYTPKFLQKKIKKTPVIKQKLEIEKGYTKGFITGIKEKPLQTTAITAGAAIAAPAFGALGKVVPQTIAKGASVLGKGITGLYGGSVAYRVASAPKGKRAQKAGEITSTEILPFAIGAKVGTKIVQGVQSLRPTRIKLEATQYTSKKFRAEPPYEIKIKGNKKGTISFDKRLALGEKPKQTATIYKSVKGSVYKGKPYKEFSVSLDQGKVIRRDISVGKLKYLVKQTPAITQTKIYRGTRLLQKTISPTSPIVRTNLEFGKAIKTTAKFQQPSSKGTKFLYGETLTKTGRSFKFNYGKLKIKELEVSQVVKAKQAIGGEASMFRQEQAFFTPKGMKSYSNILKRPSVKFVKQYSQVPKDVRLIEPYKTGYYVTKIKQPRVLSYTKRSVVPKMTIGYTNVLRGLGKKAQIITTPKPVRQVPIGNLGRTVSKFTSSSKIIPSFELTSLKPVTTYFPIIGSKDKIVSKQVIKSQFKTLPAERNIYDLKQKPRQRQAAKQELIQRQVVKQRLTKDLVTIQTTGETTTTTSTTTPPPSTIFKVPDIPPPTPLVYPFELDSRITEKKKKKKKKKVKKQKGVYRPSLFGIEVGKTIKKAPKGLIPGIGVRYKVK